MRLTDDDHFAACHLNELPAANNPLVNGDRSRVA
jgi:hypothetical protein